MKRIWSFIKALFRHWWLLLLSVLSFISTVSTYLPEYHIPKWLPLGIALVLIFVASYRAYSDQCDALDVAGKDRDQTMFHLNAEAEVQRTLHEKINSLHQDNARLKQEKIAVTTQIHSLEEVIVELKIDIQKLSRRPYDEQRLNRVKELIRPLRYFERDILRVLVLNGDCRGDVFYHQRTQMTENFDTNGHMRPLREAGFIQVEENHLKGFSTYRLNQNSFEPLKDLLFPRNEGENKPFFKGL